MPLYERLLLGWNILAIPVLILSGEASANVCRFWPVSLTVSALLYLLIVGVMSEHVFYLISISSVAITPLLIRTIMARVTQRRKNRRVEQLLLEYLRKESLVKNARE